MSERLLKGMLFVICAVTVPAEERAYLATVGPPELRFALPRSVTNAPPDLSRFIRPVSSVTNAVPSPDSASTPPPATAHLPLPMPLPAESEVAASGESSLGGASGEPLSSSSPYMGPGSFLPQPQMFLHYFSPEYMGGGSNFVSFPLPIGFAPPQPRGSSSASYELSPAQVPAKPSAPAPPSSSPPHP